MKISYARQFWLEFKIAAKECPGLFFAPLIGAFKYTDAEWDRVMTEAKARWAAYDAENAAAESTSEVKKPA